MTEIIPPLKERICFSLMAAGILGPSGIHPLCLGGCCSNWELCLYSVIFNKAELEKLNKADEEKPLTPNSAQGVPSKKKSVIKRNKKTGGLNGGIKKVRG